MLIQDPAEIPDDLVTQLWVEPLAWGICSWAPFYRHSKHFSWHGALVCRASGFLLWRLISKTMILSLWLSSYFVGASIFIRTSVPSRNTSSSGYISRARCTKDNGGLETEHQGRSGSNFCPTCCNEWCRTSRKACGNVLTRDATLQTLYSGNEYCN